LGGWKFADDKKTSPVVVVTVDGDDLYEAVEAARDAPELDWDDDDADSGDAPGLNPELVATPSRHWLGSPNPRWSESGLAVVLNCECGEWECGGVLARIEVGPDTVTWSEFREPGGGNRLALGPFTFSREQYEAALRSVSA
jgi:hypothetical protein